MMSVDSSSERQHHRRDNRPPKLYVATILNAQGQTGVQTHFNGLLRFAEERRYPAALVTPFSAPPLFVYPAVGVRRFVLARLSSSASVRWYRHVHGLLLQKVLARQLARETGPIVVYAQCPVSANAALIARRSDAQRVVMVVHFNISQADEWQEKGLIRSHGAAYRRITDFEADVLPRLDGVVHVSRFMRDEIERRIPSLRHVRSSVIPNFVPTPPFRPSEARQADLVCVGTLEPRKNQRYLLEILRSAKRLGHRYTLTFVGDGPDRSMLEREAVTLDVADQVHFLGFRDDAAELMRAHRMVCIASRMDNAPLVVLEAMARGVPVITTAVGGIPEMVRDRREAAFWPLDAPEEAAEVLIRCMDDPGRLAVMGEAGRERASLCFAPDVVAKQLFEFVSATTVAQPTLNHESAYMTARQESALDRSSSASR
jgi:glycosyltransferase involved in cell wall biosynthesis